MKIAPAVSASNGGGEARDDTGTSSSSVKPSSFSPSEKEMNNISNASVPSKYDDDEADECRICWNPGDADNPLKIPCSCSGSIKFVHQECLLQWLNHTNDRRCEALNSLYSQNSQALERPQMVCLIWHCSLNNQRKGGLPSWPHHVSHLPVCFQHRHSGA